MNTTCFIVCPIGFEGSDARKRSDTLLKHILNPVCENLGLTCVRVDEINNNDNITQTILEYLDNAAIVVADITDHNPNAFFEIGYRTATGKPIIHLKDKTEKIPFDISSIRTLDYDLSDLDAVAELKERLAKTIKASNYQEVTPGCGAVPSDNFNTQILGELYKIQDSIEDLKGKIQHSDNSAVEILADKLATARPATTPEDVLLSIVSEALKNPETMKTIMEFSKDK